MAPFNTAAKRSGALCGVFKTLSDSVVEDPGIPTPGETQKMEDGEEEEEEEERH